MRIRKGPVKIHNAISNIVGQVLIARPNERLRIVDIYKLVCALHGNRYTKGQVRKGSDWQAANNSEVIKTQLSAYKRVRLYWYEPTSDI